MKKKEAPRNRPWLLVFFLTTIIIISLTFIILFGFIKISPPKFQIESISIADNNATKLAIAFSFSNPNFVTLHYKEIDVSVGGKRRLNSTVTRIDRHLLSKQSFHDRSFLNATVDVQLPSPRPPLSDFDVRFRTVYAPPLRVQSVVMHACGGKGVDVSTVGGPVKCEVVPGDKEGL